MSIDGFPNVEYVIGLFIPRNIRIYLRPWIHYDRRLLVLTVLKLLLGALGEHTLANKFASVN